MVDKTLTQRRLQEEALKERMVDEAVSILASVEDVERRIAEKLLELDSATLYNNDDTLLRRQVLGLVAKLRREERRMDEYMTKYRKLEHEKEALLSRPCPQKPVYLRGVPPNPRGVASR